MTTQILPVLPPRELQVQVDATAVRELRWLLTSLQDTFAYLKSGLQECEALLAPVEPGSVLVVSSSRSESVKGIVSRVGTRIVKSDIQLRLQTLPPPNRTPSWPLKLASPSDDAADGPALPLNQLSTVRNLINQSLDVVDVSTWSGDAQDANFIVGQLRLLHDLLQEARGLLKGGEEVMGRWWEEPLDEQDFDPPLPPNLSLHLSIYEGSVLLVFRTLHPVAPGTPTTFTADTLPGLSLRQRLGLAARLPEHDESEESFTFRGQEVRVREKVRVESQDPGLLTLMAKLSALAHGIEIARRNLALVMGADEDD